MYFSVEWLQESGIIQPEVMDEDEIQRMEAKLKEMEEAEDGDESGEGASGGVPKIPKSGGELKRLVPQFRYSPFRADSSQCLGVRGNKNLNQLRFELTINLYCYE